MYRKGGDEEEGGARHESAVSHRVAVSQGVGTVDGVAPATKKTGPKRYHITIQRGPHIQHFLQSYTNKQWEEMVEMNNDLTIQTWK